MAGKVLNDPPAKVLRVTVSCQGRGLATTLGGLPGGTGPELVQLPTPQPPSIQEDREERGACRPFQRVLLSLPKAKGRGA